MSRGDGDMPGVVTRRTNRKTGSEIVLLDNRNQRVARYLGPYNPWGTYCVTHGHAQPFDTKMGAQRSMADPDEWCPGCLRVLEEERGSRECRVCRSRGDKRLMKVHLRHVHEMDGNGPFRFPHKPDEVLTLESLSIGGAVVKGQPKTTDVEFTNRYGEKIEFVSTGSRTRRVAPMAEVEPLKEV